MTREEAMEYFERRKNQYGLSDKVQEAENIATEALKRQIPKKPIHMHKNYYCPVCKEDGWMMWDDAVPNDMDNYCGKCGQRIDWSDAK